LVQVPEYQDARARVSRPASRGTAQERWPREVNVRRPLVHG
jgi:hypothetical protein